MSDHPISSTRFAHRRARSGALAAFTTAALLLACAASAEPVAARDGSAAIAPERAAPAQRGAAHDLPAGTREDGPDERLADAGSREAGHADTPLLPCAAPPPRFEAMPSEPGELGDFPRFPFA